MGKMKMKLKMGVGRVTLLRLMLVMPAFLLLCFAFTLPPFESRFESRFESGVGFPGRVPVIPLVGEGGESPVQALVGAIRSATAAASPHKNVSFADHHAQTWRYYNPCTSRTELGPRYARRSGAKLLDANPGWELVLEEYTTLHRTCMRFIGNVTEYYLSEATTSGCKFLIVEIEGVGLGNKVAVMISAMLYAVLTQRVILVNGESLLPSTMCEPFLGSCWILDQHFPLPGRHGWENTMLGRWAGWESPNWKSSQYFERGVDATRAGRDAPSVSAVKIDHSDPEKTRFFCNTEQAFLTKATWLHFSGCLYFLPKLFTVPAFRPALEALFPDPSLTLTYLLRSLMLPGNDVWEEVKQLDEDLFAGVARRVGIQVRFLYGRKVYFQGASKRANDHVKQCVHENNILPKIDPHQDKLETKTTIPSAQVTRVLVTSLHTALSEELLKMYENRRTATGETVKITQLTHRGQQGFGTDEDHKAMVEIMLLSFVDELLVTPLSTFGGLAQAYGAILPWFIEVKKIDGSCVRAQTFDLCYQMAHSHYDCPHEPSIDGESIERVVPYMRMCLPVEESIGLQLVPLF